MDSLDRLLRDDLNRLLDRIVASALETPGTTAPPKEDRLRLLMEQHGLTQTDLRAELGGQPVVSDILNGKREINARQAKALAARFHVSPAAFL